jgi:hypothetical protein
MSQNHIFSKPVTVLRYVSREIVWHKAEYKALHSRLPEWEKTVTFTNGGVRNGELWLHQDLLQKEEGLPTDILLLHGTHSATWIELFQRAYKLPFFLNLHRKEHDIWVELLDDYYPSFGSKGRDRFDIVPLLPEKSVAIHINARYWHSLFGRGMDTHYVENYLYLENLGVFDSAILQEDRAEEFILQPQKEVNLRQIMY